MANSRYQTPFTAQQLYIFTGKLQSPKQTEQFQVLAGAGAPTITDGFALIQTINRARRKGFTIASGYDPIGLDVPIQFEATATYTGSLATTAGQIETDIQKLEWMAGRGTLYSDGSQPATGNPPFVQVASFQANSSTPSNLIPPNVHGLTWLIAGLQYDQTPDRVRGGDRQRQAVTVSLIEYVAPPGGAQGPKGRQQGRGNSNSFKVYTLKQGETIAHFALSLGLKTVKDWQAIIAANSGRFVDWNAWQPAGTKVKIPDSLLRTGS